MNELVARLRKSCRYAGTGNEHGSSISACPGACREHSLMTDAADAIERMEKRIEELERRNDDLYGKMKHWEQQCGVAIERAERAEDTLRNINHERLQAESSLRECMAHADAMARLLATSAHYHDCYTLQEYRAWKEGQHE